MTLPVSADVLRAVDALPARQPDATARTQGSTPKAEGASFSDLLAAAGQAARTRPASDTAAAAGATAPATSHACCGSSGAANA